METNATTTTAASAATTSSTTFNVGDKFKAVVKGFRYTADWALLVVDLNGKNESIIIGDKFSNPISQMAALKGLSCEFTFRQYKTSNGNTYPQFSLDCLSF